MIGAANKKLWLALGLPWAVWALSACSSAEDETSAASNEEVAVAAAVAADEAEGAAVGQDEASTQLMAQADAQALGNPLFHGREIYLRGEMNDYGVQRPYRLRQFDENIYCTLAPLRSDWSPYRFKFADASWSQGTNFGFAVPPAVMREGSSKAMLNPNSRFEELRYEPSIDGIYRFCIEYDEQNVPYASVTYLEDGKLTTMDEIIKSEIERTFSTATTTTAANTQTPSAAEVEQEAE